jgi:hypothetical protein
MRRYLEEYEPENPEWPQVREWALEEYGDHRENPAMDDYKLRSLEQQLARSTHHGLLDWNDDLDRDKILSNVYQDTKYQKVAVLREAAKHFGATKVPPSRFGAARVLAEAYMTQSRPPRENPVPEGEKPLKKFPKGTDLTGSGYMRDRLSIWGDRVAVVEGPSWQYFDENTFDPKFIARRYLVWFTDLNPKNKKIVGRQIHFKYGDQSIYEQPFTFLEGPGYPQRIISGMLEEPVEFWVEVSKMSDLTNGEDSALQRYIDGRNYVEARQYPLTAAKWRKLLALSFDETQDQPDDLYELANAADSVAYTEGEWDSLNGVYATTKKGNIKWVITRRPKGTGL